MPSLFGVIIVALAVSLMTSGRHGAPLVHGAAAGMLAPVYIGLPLGALVGIHQIAGREGVLTLIATVAASDTFQYYSGRTFGKRPLAPTISPKKTIEGAIGGFVLAPLALVAMAYWWLPRLNPGAVWLAGLGIVMAGIAGDLFESSFKRAAGLKDSGSLIPGHGGVLDRIDALLFCAPLFYLLLTVA
jgi:phosphatidate cytidylyltransferase